MALPALASVRATLPGTRITVAALPSVAPMFEEETSAGVDEVVTIPDRRREGSVLALGEFDAALVLPNSFRSAWVLRRAGIPERWGFSAGARGPLLTRAVRRPRAPVHQAAYYAALVAGLGFEATESVPRVRVREETAQRAEALLAKHGVTPSSIVVGFAPGAA